MILSQLTQINPFSVVCPVIQVFGHSGCENCGQGKIPVLDKRTTSPGIVSCKDCQPFEIVNGNICEKCPDGEIPNDDKTECIPCAANEIILGCRDTCTACDIGMVANLDKTECVGKCSFQIAFVYLFFFWYYCIM